MQYLQVRKQVDTLLTDLGHTSGEVAMTLRNSGVRGTPRDVHSCAVALYLNAILGGEAHVHSVEVYRTTVRVFAGRPRIRMSISLSEPLQAFIQAFDRRLYPDLIRADQEDASRASTE